MARRMDPDTARKVSPPRDVAVPSWKASSPLKVDVSALMPPIKAFRQPYKCTGDRREVSGFSDAPGHGLQLSDAAASRVPKQERSERAERPVAPQRERRLPKSSSTGTIAPERFAPLSDPKPERTAAPPPAPAFPADPARPTIAETTSLTKSRSAAALGARSGALPPLHRAEARHALPAVCRTGPRTAA
jgi:hypothetical protein